MKNHSFKLITLLLLFSQYAFAQQMPIDFSDTSDNFDVWGGSTFTILPSPTDSNNPTGEFFRSSSTSQQGQFIDLISPINLDIEDKITLKFHAFDPNAHTIVVKLENGTNPSVEVSQTIVSQFTWTDLIFDFSTVGGAGSYSRLVIRIDDGSSIPGAFRIDDINDGSIPTDPNALDVIYTDLVWADEFDTPGDVNSSNWFKQTKAIIPGFGWANNEEQHYTDRLENSFVDNMGNLNIVAKRETYTSPPPENITKSYTSARLNSKFAFTYGRVDVRAKLPEGDGTWPAIWTLGKNISEGGAYWQIQGFGTTPWTACGEIDIMEHGLGDVNYTSSALHTPSSSGATINYRSQEISDVALNWHIYSVNWSPNQITFLVDDVAFYTYNPAVKNASTWPFDLEQYLILNIAMGGISGTIDPNFTESPMIIDYVRVYQNNVLSTEELKVNAFKVYPNPAHSEINIKSDVKIDRVELYDILGKLILEESETPNSIKVNNLNSGLYLLNIFSEGSKTVKKVVIK